MQSSEKKSTGIKRLEMRIGRLWGFRREKEGIVAKLPPEKTVGRLIHLFIASVNTIGSFLREKMGETGVRSVFEYQGEKFGEGLEKWPWRADEIAKNMIRLNFQPFGIEAHYSGDKNKATIVVEKCPLPDNFGHSVEYLREFTAEPHGAVFKGEAKLRRLEESMSTSWDWLPKKPEVCATCRIVMPKLGEKLGFSWKHSMTSDAPPKCVFEIQIAKGKRQV
ncbi:MAG: hypothetical protein JSW53_05920 [Candidatus Bathyarchaeota archaeon]|nr:MAG: hypothetical protein JSW53_05920 [Candidatus Bathyarchaeota archaeon]